jgi:hypothetical protein
MQFIRWRVGGKWHVECAGGGTVCGLTANGMSKTQSRGPHRRALPLELELGALRFTGVPFSRDTCKSCERMKDAYTMRLA